MLLHGYVDGELDLVKSLEYEQHLQECSGCAQALEALQAMRATIKGQALYFEPPAHLQTLIQASGIQQVVTQIGADQHQLEVDLNKS